MVRQQAEIAREHDGPSLAPGGAMRTRDILGRTLLSTLLLGCVMDDGDVGDAEGLDATDAELSAYTAPTIGTVTIDGNLGEWGSIPALTFASASVKLAVGSSNLYAAFQVKDTELIATESLRDGNIYKDD